MQRTLETRLASLDAARFVGRSAELARFDALLREEPPANVVLLHGPAGIGKSALMREFRRRAVARGWTPLTIDAREITPLAETLEAALAPAMHEARPLILLDSWERLSALDGLLRRQILPRLAPQALVVIASRGAPSTGWFSAGWEHLVLELRLSLLDAGEADALLAARGVTDRAGRSAAIAWAGGSPLALVLAADVGGVPDGIPADDGPAGLIDALLRRLLDAQPEGEQRSILAVAALAHVTTPELIGAALPGIDETRAFAWLCGHASAEPFRDGVMLHNLVGRALRADLRHRSPVLERDLRRRLADALYAKSKRGGLLQLTLDLQHLVQDPAIRWGFSWDRSGRYRIDAPRPTDVANIAERGGRAALAWLRGAERYFDTAPDRVVVVRDQDDVIAGYGVAVTPANVPGWWESDPVIGPRVRHAAENAPDGHAIVFRQAVDLTHEPSSPVTALIGMAGVISSGLENPAMAYLPIPRGDAAATAFARACGARAVDELAVEHGGVTVECHVLDYGPGGLLAFQRAAVYRELGVSAPSTPTLEQVREALRHYGSPALLAMSALAEEGVSPAERAAAARARIDRAVSDAFGPSPQDQLLRRVLIRGYLDPPRTQELAASELHLSRTAYFRQLRAAVLRVAAELGVPA